MTQSKNVLWISNLRVIATIAVVGTHVASPIVSRFGEISNSFWMYSSFFESSFRFCVPIFVMVSGALLLGRTNELNYFFKKRFTRIVIPFVFWSILYVLFSIYIKASDYEQMNFFEIIKKIIRSIWFGSYYHLWFVYLILGLYLVVPIISVWTSRAIKKELNYFIFLFGLTILFRNELFKNYSPAIQLSYFSGYMGYFILGYYLSIIEIENYKKGLFFSITCIFLGLLTTLYFTYKYSVLDGVFNEKYFDFLGINIIILSIGVFQFFKTSIFLNHYSNYFFRQINQYGFGIYLIHAFVLWCLDLLGINGLLINPLVGIPMTTILCVVFSLLIVKVINKLPYGHYVSG